MFKFKNTTGIVRVLKQLGLVFACMAGGHASGQAADATGPVPPENPYAAIASRNIFGLTPPPPPPAASVPESSPPPSRIKPNGIISLFGSTQVLFKATPTDPGSSDHEKTYILGIGQQEDGIAVVDIDEKTLLITFDNHGVNQQLSITSASDFTPPDLPPPIPGSSSRTLPVPGARHHS